MRIHISALVLVSFFSYYYGLEKNQYLILVLCCGFVISAEAVNTAIEALVNLESPAYHQLARVAKDVAAGAVLVAAVTAGITGVVLFGDPAKLLETLKLIFSVPLRGIVLLLLLVSSVFFIFNTKNIAQPFIEKSDRE